MPADAAAEVKALAGAGEDADAMAALGLPSGFGRGRGGGGGGGRGRRGHGRRGHGRRGQAPRPESSGLLPTLPAPDPGSHTRFGGDEESEDAEKAAGPGPGQEEAEEEEGGGGHHADASGGSPPPPLPPPSPPGTPRSPPLPAPTTTAIASPPRTGPPSDPALLKYWRARHALWGPAYGAGILMDAEGWFSATPAVTAAHQAARLVTAAAASRAARESVADCERKGAQPAPLTLVDAFCGCGGNTARLAAAAPPGSTGVAVDTDAGRAAAAAANAALVLGAAGKDEGGGGGGGARVEVVVSDFMAWAAAQASALGGPPADAVFMSPPWGGPAYKQAAVLRLATDVGGLGVGLGDLVGAAAAACGRTPTAPPVVAAFLPRNACLRDIAAAAAAVGLAVEVQREVIEDRVRSVTAYFGGAVGPGLRGGGGGGAGD